MDTNNQIIYIGNIPVNCTNQELVELFSPFGPITHIKIPHNLFHPDQQLNYAFVKLEAASQMTLAVKSLHGQTYKDQILLLKLVDELEPEINSLSHN